MIQYQHFKIKQQNKFLWFTTKKGEKKFVMNKRPLLRQQSLSVRCLFNPIKWVSTYMVFVQFWNRLKRKKMNGKFFYSFSDSIHLCPSKICFFYWSHELSRLIRHNTFLPRPDHWRSSGIVIKFSILTHIVSMYFIFNVRKTPQKVPFDVFFHPIWPIILFFISYERTL